MEAGETVKNVLLNIASNFLWLFELHEFRIVNSSYDPSFGGQGVVEMSNGSLLLRFASDRDRVFVEVGPTNLVDWPEQESVTIDLVYREIVGRPLDITSVCPETTTFMKDNFDAISQLFTQGCGKTLWSKFKKLKNERAKRLFG